MHCRRPTEFISGIPQFCLESIFHCIYEILQSHAQRTVNRCIAYFLVKICKVGAHGMRAITANHMIIRLSGIPANTRTDAWDPAQSNCSATRLGAHRNVSAGTCVKTAISGVRNAKAMDSSTTATSDKTNSTARS